jgi:3-oxoacyl-[acyl-carrier protein] reductase
MNSPRFSIGLQETLEFTATRELVDAFASLSGDDNPLHMDDRAAKASGFPQRVAHGVLSLAFLSALIGKKLPGAGALWRSLKVNWLRPVFPGDTIRITGEVTQVSGSTGSILIGFSALNQNGTLVFQGDAQVGTGDPVVQLAEAPPAPLRLAQADPAPERSARPAFIITGGSRGIGRAIALQLGRSGHPLALVFNHGEEAARSAVAAIEQSGGRACAVRMDLRRPVDSAAIRGAEAVLGPLLGLVHAASPPLQNLPFDQLSSGAYENYFRVYIGGAVEIVQLLMESMKENRFGRVVLMGSAATIGAPPARMSAYVTAKSAVTGLCKTLAVELGPMGVTVNTISPGLTMTDLTRDYSPRMQMAEAMRNPMRRLALPEDAAALVAFLLSPAASYLTGADIPLTGGANVH